MPASRADDRRGSRPLRHARSRWRGNPDMLVKDHSESDIRVDPHDPKHLIGQSKWFVNAEGYNHLLGFYESFDGGLDLADAGPRPRLRGLDRQHRPRRRLRSLGQLLLARARRTTSITTRPDATSTTTARTRSTRLVPPEAVAVSVRPHGATGPDAVDHDAQRPAGLRRHGQEREHEDPDKQWITIDTNPSSPCYRTVYAMWTVFVINPSVLFVSTADAKADGTHTDWTAPQELPTVNGKRWDSYLLPHIAPDGTVYTTITNNPQQQGFCHDDIYLVWSTRLRRDLGRPTPVIQGVSSPTYQNTTFREGIVNTFAVGTSAVGAGLLPALRVLRGRLDRSLERLPDGLLRRRPTLDDTVPGERQRRPDRGAPAQPGRRRRTARSLSRSTTGAFAAPRAATRRRRGPGIAVRPDAPYGASNYCINTAIQFYDAEPRADRPQHPPVREHLGPAALRAHQGCICCSGTFIGDYFGVDSAGGWTYTTSVSTFNDAGENPSNHQQQIVARIPIPQP